MAQTPIRHIIFWQTVIKTFRSTYVNCFHTLRFLAETSTKLQKMHFLDNLRTITQEASTETRQMTPFFLSTISALAVCNCLSFLYLKMVKIHFPLVPPLVSSGLSILSKSYWFGQPIILSQPLGQDQQNSKQTYCQLPITWFLWTPKGSISPESFLNFLLNLYIPPWLPKSFKFIVLRLLQSHLWVKKLNLFNFTHAPKQNSRPGFCYYPPVRRELHIPHE